MPDNTTSAGRAWMGLLGGAGKAAPQPTPPRAPPDPAPSAPQGAPAAPVAEPADYRASSTAFNRKPASQILVRGRQYGSRTLDVAIREYAPGAEVVVDGLVHLSEGVRPAWSANADASGLEDLQHFWECNDCGEFGLVRVEPLACPDCGAANLSRRKVLRPAGFIGGRRPHTGYENLRHLPFEAPRLSARRAPWQALPDPRTGRLRADVEGEVVTMNSGRHGHGYAPMTSCPSPRHVPNPSPRLVAPIQQRRPTSWEAPRRGVSKLPLPSTR